MNTKYKRLLIIIEENNAKFSIDVNQDITLTDIFEIIYEGKYLQNYNISEHCGLLQYAQDQVVLKIISDRQCKIYNLIENNMVLSFMRGPNFYDLKSKFGIKPETLNTDVRISAGNDRTYGPKIGQQQNPVQPQNQPEFDETGQLDNSVTQNRVKPNIKLISVQNGSQVGQQQQQQQQQSQQPYQQFQQQQQNNSTHGQYTYLNQQSQFNKEQSQNNLSSQNMSSTSSNLTTTNKKLRLLKTPTTQAIQLDIIIYNLRSTYYIIPDAEQIKEIDQIIPNQFDEYAGIQYLDYMNQQINHFNLIKNYDYIQVYPCPQGYGLQNIQFEIEAERNFFQYKELYQYQLQKQSAKDLQPKRLQSLFCNLNYNQIKSNESQITDPRQSIIIKNNDYQIHYQTYKIKQNNRYVGALAMKIQNKEALLKQLPLLLQQPENSMQITENEILIINN